MMIFFAVAEHSPSRALPIIGAVLLFVVFLIGIAGHCIEKERHKEEDSQKRK